MPEIQDDGRYEAPRAAGRRVDLHAHSNCSDGLLTPTRVIEAARERGLAAVALTDHDTMAGLAEAGEAARSAEIAFVPGIELSTYDEKGSTHLLGYFVDASHSGFLEFLDGARENRMERAEEIVRKLNGLGVELSFESVLEQASEGGLVARPHVARALLQGGWVKSYGEAFNRFIAAGAPAYVPTQRVSPEEGVARIHEARGVAVLAHGGRTHDDARIEKLVRVGLDGLETLHPDHGPEQVKRMRRLAAELDLLETGGSDWHGPRDTRRGRLGQLPVPLEWLERLGAAAGVRVAGMQT